MASPAIFWYKNLILSSYLKRNYTFQSNIKNTISSHYAMEQTLYNRFFMSARNFSFIQKKTALLYLLYKQNNEKNSLCVFLYKPACNNNNYTYYYRSFRKYYLHSLLKINLFLQMRLSLVYKSGIQNHQACHHDVHVRILYTARFLHFVLLLPATSQIQPLAAWKQDIDNHR